ncbi:restriction endonuclease subunit S [Rhizobium rhizoryzae]|uniref:Type I restriction enzyme S subunit n=1 Tax=Rhizobium rhizoryzae TaxID=451876 RepID=A0A7W6LGZ6_9HYPH|nr:restriction endonuclease subunit S [Rhizobium rhizoryzae]MBB4143123.1 type I restriction enzyme S subunit [Rhizobium rhizoryzae]
MIELPRGWVESSVDEVGEISSGFGFPDRFQGNVTGELPFAKVRDISQAYQRNGGILSGAGNYVSRSDLTALKARTVPAGSVAFAKIGEALKLNRRVLLDVEAVLDNNCMAVTPHQGLVEPKFLYRFLTTLDFAPFSVATTVPSIRKGDVGSIRLPLPPLAEQKRIVAKLDALNAKSTRARTELARIETLVSRYKQAVLSKAFSGELTAAQFAHPDGDRSAGHPAHWKQMQLGEIADIKSGITLGKKRKPDEKLLELPYLRVANVQRGWLNLREIKTIEVTSKEADALFLCEGDVLMNEGGDRDKLGRGWVWDGQIPDCIHQNHVFRVRLASGTVPPRFLSYYANEFGQKHFFDEGKQTTNLASISKSKLSAMTVPVPPFEEAIEIVRRIESAFAKIDRLAKEAKRALELVGRLDEAILAKAFRGELVPQDENDEPAEHLLARIRAEREAAPKGKRKRG